MWSGLATLFLGLLKWLWGILTRKPSSTELQREMDTDVANPDTPAATVDELRRGKF